MKLRPVVVVTLVACVLLAAAPWLSGGQEPVAMLIAGAALLLAALFAWVQPEVRRLRIGPLPVAYGLLMVLGLASLLWSANRYSTGLWLVEWLLAGLAFRVAYTVAGEPEGKEWLIRGYLASAAIFCVVAIWMFMDSAYPRLTGTFYWPNPAAAYLMPAILVAIERIRTAEGKAWRFWAAAAALFGVSFALTDSRAAILVLGLVLGVYLLVVPLRRLAWTRIVFVVLVGILGSFLVTYASTFTAHRNSAAIPGSRFAEAASGESRSLKDRLYYLQSAYQMWAKHPLVGVGAGTYGDVHPQYQQRVVSAATSAHNVYAQTWAELGLAGGLALVAMLLALAAGLARGVVDAPRNLVLGLGLLCLLMHFGLDIDARYPTLLILAGVLVGLAYVERQPQRGKVTLVWPALAACLLVPVVSLYLSDAWAQSANIAQDDGDLEGAAVRYGMANRGVLYNPDNVNAEGIVLYALAAGGGKDAKTSAILAQQRARRAEQLDPYDGQHHQLEGRILALQGDFSGAETQLRQALALDPYNHPEYALDLASVQVAAGDGDGAIRTAEAMLKLYPAEVVANRNADSTIRPTLANLEALIGNVWLKRGDLGKAAAAGRRALRHYPPSIRAQALVNQAKKLAEPAQ